MITGGDQGTSHALRLQLDNKLTDIVLWIIYFITFQN